MQNLVEVTIKNDPEVYKLFQEYNRLRKELNRAKDESHYAAVAEERAEARASAALANFWDAFEVIYGRQSPEVNYCISHPERGKILVEFIPDQGENDEEED